METSTALRVAQIWKYPVKSMLGSQVASATLAEAGVVGDRMWALRDEKRNAIASGRRVAGIARLAAAFEGDGVVIRLPDGTTVADSDGDVNERLTAAVEHPVTLWPRQPASATDFYRRGQPDSSDALADLRGIFGRQDDEPLPDFSVFPPELRQFEYPPGNYFDCFPLMIMSTSAMRSLREALPESVIDERRFRPSLVVDTGDAPGHPEFDWTGRRLRIGAAEIQVGAGCPRCVMITRNFADDLPADRAVLRHVVRDLDQNVGVYATVTVGGEISVDDPVQLV